MVQSTKMPVVIGVVVGVVGVAAILGLSRITQSDQDQANSLADLHTAKAMRLLTKYEANLAQIARIRAQLGRQLGTAEEPLAIPPSGRDAEEVVRGHLEEFQALSKDLRDRGTKDPAAKLEAEVRRLTGDAPEVQEMPRLDLGQNEGAIAKAITSAGRNIDGLMKENAKLLKQAERETDEALGVQVGQASTRENVNANHVRAYILYAQAEVRREEANAVRAEADAARHRALRLIADADRLLSRIKQAEKRRPTKRAESLSAERADLEKKLTDARQRLGELKTRVAGLREQIKAADAKASAGQAAIQALEAKGYDPKNPDDVKRYVSEYAEQSAAVRQARLEAAAVTHGTLEGVKLDDAHGGDLLKDRYVPEPGGKGRTVVRGLIAYEKDLAQAEKTVADVEALLKQSAARAQKAEASAKRLAAYQAELVKRKAGVDAKIKATLAEADQRSEAALKIETEALALLKKAGQAYNQAARAARNRGGELAGDPSVKELPKDNDTEAAMNIGQADVAHAEALIYLQQVRDLHQRIAAMKAAVAADVAGLDKAKIQELGEALATAQKASDKAVEDSIKKLDPRNTRGMGRNYQWIPQVRLATAHQLKSLVDVGPNAVVAREEAIAEYGQAIEGREASPYLKPYVRAVEQLRQRAPAEGAPSKTQPATATKPTGEGAVPDTRPAQPTAEKAAKRAPEKPEAKPARPRRR